MLNQIGGTALIGELFNTTSWVTGELNLSSILLILAAALGLGLVVAGFYILIHRHDSYAASFPMTLVMLPVIISVIIYLIGNNVASAFSLAGAFSLIRFRSAPGDPKDIAYVFFALAVGLACGMGYIAFATVAVIFLCLAMLFLEKIHFGDPHASCLNLKITMPEQLSFEGSFDDVLDDFAQQWKLTKVKSVDFGSLYELSYQVKLLDNTDRKAFIDRLRQRNGNLNIELNLKPNDML